MRDLRQRITNLEKRLLDDRRGTEFHAAEVRRGLAYFDEFGQTPDDLDPRIARSIRAVHDAVLANNVYIWKG